MPSNICPEWNNLWYYNKQEFWEQASSLSKVLWVFFFQMAGFWHTTFLIHCKILAGSNHQLSLTLTLWMDDCGLRVELWECVGSGDWDEGHSILDLLEARYILDL